jgi:DNA-binding MarR family transcriptional regulator
MTDRAKLRSEQTVEISQELHEMARRTIELVYFAHIDQADWADHVLAKHGIGRPHHRVLYFSHRFPGISVRELMVILRITNQALARTTTQLVTLGQTHAPSGRAVGEINEATRAERNRRSVVRLGKNHQAGRLALAASSSTAYRARR